MEALNQIHLEPQLISLDVIKEKYCEENETCQEDIFRRVSKKIASVEKTPKLRKLWEKKFMQMMIDGGIGGGRIMASAGTELETTLLNCFVMPVGDSITGIDSDGFPGIYTALAESAETLRRGGGVGYDFSKIRPMDAYVKGTDSFASGPCSYMDVFDKSCTTVESAGCFAGDTLINTDKGLVTVKYIVEHPEIEYSALTHLGYRKIIARFNNGEKKLYKVTTEYGYSVRVTDEHKFAQLSEGKIITRRLKDIVNSDNKRLLLLSPNNDGFNFVGHELVALGYLVGAFLGNGSWTKNEIGISGITIVNHDDKKPVIKRIVRAAQFLGLNPKIRSRKNENCTEVKLYNTKFFNSLKELGIEKGNCLKVPDLILNSSSEIQASFIAGLFDADGSVSESKSNIRLRMISKELLGQVQVMLLKFGVMSKLSLERKAIGNWKEIYCLGIYGAYAQAIFNNTVANYSVQKLQNKSTRDGVGYGHYWVDVKEFGYRKSIFKQYWPGNETKHPKISMNAIVNSDVTSPELLNTVTVEIQSIEDSDIETVYDLEVDEVHLLAGNGIYTSNSRRGAMLSALRIDHPDIESFITAKRTKGRWNNFNVSVMVSDSFMESVANNGDWELVHKARPTKKLIEENSCYQREDGLWVYKTIKSRELWEKIMKSNYDFAEPGILFEDNIDRQNNLNYVEKIIATNPCGEIPLPPYGCCDLGLVILPKLVHFPFKNNACFDFNLLKEIVQSLVRFLDNVLDATKWPIPQQKAEADSKRRLGVGFTGLGNAIAMMGFRYDDEYGREFAEQIGQVISETAYRTSIELAKEKGSFPLFKVDEYLRKGTFASTLAEDIQNDIRKYGIRNSHLLTCAPTGTTSLAFADNASNGIEPPFSLAYTRKKRKQHGGEEYYTVMDHSLHMFLSQMENRDIAEKIEKAICSGESTFKIGEDVLNVKKYLPTSIIGALEMSADSHLLMMASMQKYIDQSISKTINVPVEYPFDDFKNIYLKAHEYGLKGVATYRPNSILGSVLSEIKKEDPKTYVPAVKEPSPNEDFEIFMNKVIHQLPDDEYPAIRKRVDYLGPEGKDNFYLLVSLDRKAFVKDSKTIIAERPVEVFIETNPDNVPSEWVDSLSRNLSLLARSGINLFTKALDNCKKAKSDKGRIRYGFITKPDGTQVPRYHASQIDCIGFAIKEILQKRNIINDAGKPTSLDQLFKIQGVAVEDKPQPQSIIADGNVSPTKIFGKVCSECGDAAVIKRDGCDFCTNCGAQGSCG